MIDVELYYDGRWRPGRRAQRFRVRNPATGATIGSAATADAEDLDLVIQSAVRAGPSWADSPPERRGRTLQAAYQAIMENQEHLARLLTTEEGKSLAEARSEIAYGARFFEYYAGESVRIFGETMPSPSSSRSIWTVKVPVGVSAVITPWNYPFAMICRKMAPALAAGCTLVVKPAEQTPLIAAELFRVLEVLNLPPGTVNFITGDPALIGPALVGDSRIRKVSFTGSTSVGRTILRNAAENITSVSLELGGNAPFIVFDDASVEDVVNGILSCKFRNAGQICVATNRIYVQRGVAAAIQDRLSEAVQHLRVGDGLDDNTQVGPLINQEAVEKVSQHVADAIQQGATVVVGGQVRDGVGFFYLPTVITGVQDTMQVAQEETFGPVAPLLIFDAEEEVYARANQTPYGLAAYVYTRDLGRAMRASRALEFGMVGINDPVPSLVEAPIGGLKASGLGREGGHEGVLEFLETKYVSTRF